VPDLASLSAALPAGVTGAFSTRGGGISPPPWDGLNLSQQVGDQPERVTANRERLTGWLGAPVVFADQVHGPEVAVVTAGNAAGPRSACDGLLTAEPGLALAVLVADCLPVLFADPVAGVVAAAHAGRRGLVAGILQRTVAAMTALGADPGRMTAVIGPGIGGCCYEVPRPLLDQVAAVLPEAASTTTWGTPALDLPRAAGAVLRVAGVACIERTSACTYEDDRFYSFRRAPVTGRFAGVVVRR